MTEPQPRPATPAIFGGGSAYEPTAGAPDPAPAADATVAPGANGAAAAVGPGADAPVARSADAPVAPSVDAAAAAVGPGADPAASPEPHAGTGPTGHPTVDAALAALDDAEHRTAAEQVAAYEAAHRALQQTLATIDQG